MVATARATKAKVNSGDGKLSAEAQAEMDEPTREDVFQAALWVARHTNRVPTFLGPTASGKTHGVGTMAKNINAELITVLLGQHTPDEIAGFQLAINNELVVQMPYWFRQAEDTLKAGKSVVILFDELSLSREETRGALYTFFRDRHLHGHTLTPQAGRECILVAASNSGVFAPPFRSRCLFLPVPADRRYLAEMSQGSLGKKIAQMAPLTSDGDAAYSNAAPPPPETYDASAAAVMNAVDNAKTGFWLLSEPARFLVLSGVVPAQTLNAILKDRGLDASALARKPDELARALRALPRDKRHSMINNTVETLPNVTPDERAEALCAILDVLYDDETAEDIHTYFSTPRDDSVVKAVTEINPDYLEKILKDKGLLSIAQDAKGNTKITGTLAERIQKMVKATKGD